MPLAIKQARDLEAAILRYAYPPIYFDFINGAPVNAGNMRGLEGIIGEMLLSRHIDQTMYGLANVIYWGNANAGYQMHRVRCFINEVSNDKLALFQGLVANNNIPTVNDIYRIRMPQFSGISFISKIIAFLDPANHCVLDLQLFRLGAVHDDKALHHLVAGTQIRVTSNNSETYSRWCRECREISDRYYNNRYRVVDVERGFFQLIQENKLHYAQNIYSAA